MVCLIFVVVITVTNDFLALEFLYVKGGIIHSDISMNNVMINRVWDCEPHELPSRLRMLICALRQLAIDANDKDDDAALLTAIEASTTVTTEPQASTISVIQALTIDTSTVHVATTSTTVISTPSVSELTPVTQAHDSTSPLTVSSANAVSVVQVSAPSVISQAPATSDEAHSIHVPTALAYHGPTDTSMAIAQVNMNTELVPVIEEPDVALVPREHSDTVADWTGTTEPIESSGMIIDGDFMQYKSQETNLTSVRKPALICDYVY